MSDEVQAQEAVAFVKNLAEAVSTQARVANRAWIAMMGVALVALLPRVPRNGGDVNLPLGLGVVESDSYAVIAFLMLSILVIAFATAHAQQMRAQTLAQRAIDGLDATLPAGWGVHPRELFDMCRMPSVNRVAPLAQLVRGAYQFHERHDECPKWRRMLSVAYYVSLKGVASMVFFLVPAAALWRTHHLAVAVGDGPLALSIVMATSGLIAATALLHVAIVDTGYVVKIVRFLWTEPSAIQPPAVSE